MNLRALLTIAFAIAAIWSTPALAQDRPAEWSGPGPAAEPPDFVFMKLLTERKRGLVVIGAAGAGCSAITVGRGGDSKPSTIRLSIIKLGSYGGIGILEPGQYAVLSVKCEWGNATTTLNGPFATFSIGAGEMVDVGVLKVDYKLEYMGLGRNGTLHTTIMSISPETVARLKEKVPRSVARMINRQMVMVGAADVPIKRQGL